MKTLEPGGKHTSDNNDLDRSVLNKLAMEIGDENMVSLVSLFIDELDLHLGRIKRASKESDLSVLVRSGHTLKSSVASFGAIDLGRLAGKMEEKAMRKDTEGAHALAVRLLHEAQTARAQLLIFYEDARLQSSKDPDRSC